MAAAVSIAALALLSILATLHFAGSAGASARPAELRLEVSSTTSIEQNCTLSPGSPFAPIGRSFELTMNYTGAVEDLCSDHDLEDPGGYTITVTAGYTAALFVEQAGNLSVVGFDLLGPGTALALRDATNVTATNDKMATTGLALEVYDSSEILGTYLDAPGTSGAELLGSSSVALESSNLSHSSAYGVYALTVTGLSITGNNLSDAARGGANIDGGTSVVVRSNDLSFEGSAPGIVATAVGELNVSGNNASEDSFAVEADADDSASFWSNVVSPGTYQPYAINDSLGVTITNASALEPGTAGILLAGDSGVTIDDAKCTLSGYGVEIVSSSNVQISDSNLSNANSGVEATGATNLSVLDSDLGGGNNGLWAESGTGIRVTDSNLSHANYPVNLTGTDENVLIDDSDLDAAQVDGVYLNGDGNVSLLNSSIERAVTAGIDAIDPEDLTVTGSSFSGNASSLGAPGILIEGGDGTTLANDTWNWDATPISISGEDSVSIMGGSARNASGTALELESDTGVTVTGLDLANGTGAGIEASNVSSLTIARADLDGIADDAILLTDSGNVEVDSSSFADVGATAVFASDSEDVLAVNDSFQDDGYSFFLETDNSVSIVGSTALADSDGVLAADAVTGLLAADDNFSANSAADLTTFAVTASEPVVVSGCTFDRDFEALAFVESIATVSGNTFSGDNYSFNIDPYSQGLFFHNDFDADHGWLLAGLPAIAWNEPYPYAGNYWSNYTGSDHFSGPDQNLPGPDGIGDTPFVLNTTEVDYYPLMNPWVDHTAVFVETGLPVGASWSVTVNGSRYLSTTNSIVVYSTVGAFTEFTYSIAPADGLFPTPSAGSGKLGNGSVVVSVSFRPPAYPQSFAVDGLPANTTWAVVVDGVTHSALTPDSIVLPLANGTYDYTVAPVPGYLISPYSGVLHVSGTRQNVTFRAVVFLFELRFIETGLPLGLSWNLAVNGTTSYSSSDVNSFSLANGTYSFAVNSSGGYSPLPASGSFTVQGSDGDIFVHFAQPGSSNYPPPGGGGSAPSSSDYLPYEVAIGVAAGVGVLGWVLAAVYRRRVGPKNP
jgi:hypothetical protein